MQKNYACKRTMHAKELCMQKNYVCERTMRLDVHKKHLVKISLNTKRARFAKKYLWPKFPHKSTPIL